MVSLHKLSDGNSSDLMKTFIFTPLVNPALPLLLLLKERAVYHPELLSAGPPRSLLLKHLHYRVREIILCKARELKDIIQREALYFPDFSAEVQHQRAK